MVFLEISQNSQENTCARGSLTLLNFLFCRKPQDDCFWMFKTVARAKDSLLKIISVVGLIPTCVYNYKFASMALKP